MTSQTVFVLTVDTENYAGNFERELGAYCTGCVHEYDHSGIAAAAAQEMRFGQWWVEHITAHQGVDEEYPPVYFLEFQPNPLTPVPYKSEMVVLVR